MDEYWDSKIYDRLYSESYETSERYCEIMHHEREAECEIGTLVEFIAPSVFRTQFVLNAIIPIVLGWISTYFAIGVVRWIFAGRENSN